MAAPYCKVSSSRADGRTTREDPLRREFRDWLCWLRTRLPEQYSYRRRSAGHPGEKRMPVAPVGAAESSAVVPNAPGREADLPGEEPTQETRKRDRRLPEHSENAGQMEAKSREERLER